MVGAVGVVLMVSLAWMWQRSLVPDTYSVMDMGYPDYGGGAAPGDDSAAGAMAGHGGHATDGAQGAHGSATPVGVDTLLGPSGRPDVSVTLTARSESIHLDGEGAGEVAGFTLNHRSPGPTITADVGDLVQVRLVNESVTDGIALHWHGVDVPNGEDGVAGVTQDAVEEGAAHVYRFVAEDPGTYWYHSHQVSDEQVAKGLLGALVIAPGDPAMPAAAADTVAVVHSYAGLRTVNGTVGTERVEAEPGSPARVRVINTNDGPLRTWVSGSAYRVLAVDGQDLNGPEEVEEQAVVVPAGGRVDLLVTVPSDGTAATVDFGGGTRVAVGPPDGEPVTGDDPSVDLDLLSYGEPAEIGLDPAHADRTFEYRIGRRIAFLDGRPGFWWTINGRLYPDVPMYVVEEGDIVTMTISNSSGEVHPMHLHGHHAVVLSRNGKLATGSPWWVDSLDVEDGESYEIAFVADNPGIWMDHCHNLPHASEGLVTHLMYAGVTTPYVIGGEHANDPE
ncbi:MAG TPA: multicopper oxidase family protein [Nocardioidaceae bacterium]|nr:multicopper oxidase family protein [Nocardioidaceae bacterium]